MQKDLLIKQAIEKFGPEMTKTEIKLESAKLDIGDELLPVTIEQATQSSTNYLVGGQWDVNRSFSILAELGFGDRESQMLSFTYRF